MLDVSRLTSHDVVSVGDETDDEEEGENGDLPQWDRGLGCSGPTGGPYTVQDSPWTDRVSDVVGTVGKRSSASGEDLDERVGVLGLVGVHGRMGVDALHALAVWSTGDTDLSGVDVVMHTVEKTTCDDGRETDDESLEVVEFIDATGTHWVVAKETKRPTHWAAAGDELSLELGVALLAQLGIAELRVDAGPSCGRGDGSSVLLVVADILSIEGRGGRVWVFWLFLDDSVVWNDGGLGDSRGWPGPERRSHEDVPPSERIVFLDDLGVQEWDEEDGGNGGDSEARTKSDGDDIPGWLLVQAKVWRTLVDNGECANGCRDEEPERRGVDGDRSRVLAHVNNNFDQHENDASKTSSDRWSHEQTGEDGTHTLSTVPSPLNLAGTDGSNTNTSDGGDKGVGG